MENVKYDETGKVILHDIYDKPTPAPYYSRLSAFDYCIPEQARPHFERAMDARCAATDAKAIKVLDVGCSYGVNASLLKYGKSLNELVQHYRAATDQGLDRDALLAADRALYAYPERRDVTIVGLDASEPAIDYAVGAGILDDGLTADLEAADPDADVAARLGDADLIISTGCYGYISEKTLDRLLDINRDKSPWMAHFVLRMFDFSPAAESLSERGYLTRQIGLPVRQRRFVDAGERAHVLDNLAARGIDPKGREADGWYFAELHLSAPEAVAAPFFAYWDDQAAAAE